MSALLVVNTSPYGSEGPYNAFRLAEALSLRDEHVEVFLKGDAVQAARAVDVSCCGTCCSTRGLAEDDLIPSVRVATIHDLAAATTRSDKVVSF
jgi:uncharacterized protein involved in oxidation of intracellular sulfur